VLRSAGAEAVRKGIAGAETFEEPADAEAGLPDVDARAEVDEQDADALRPYAIVSESLAVDFPLTSFVLTNRVSLGLLGTVGYLRRY
jgi:hypothetical protein